MLSKSVSKRLAHQRPVMQKTKAIRSQKYIDWVKSLPCVISGMPADDAHHLIGHGYSVMGSKAHDIWTFPLARGEHSELHRIGWKEWEDLHGSQWKFVGETLAQAVKEGLVKIEGYKP